MADIYDQHAAAFRNISAHVIVHNGERVATIAHKRGSAGGITAYVHWYGLEMVKGHAGGYGYDKGSAACASAIRKMRGKDGGWLAPVPCADSIGPVTAFLNALDDGDRGAGWIRALEKAGFAVWQAV